LYEAKSKETIQAEQMIKKELADLKDKIESLLLVKKRDNFSTVQSIEKQQKKIQNLEKSKEKLVDEKVELEKSIESIKQMTDDNYQKRVSVFKRTIRPLEDSKRLVIEEKEVMEQKIDLAEKEIIKLQSKIADTQSSQSKQTGFRNNHVKTKIELHEKMDEYKNNYPDELQLFYEEEKNKQEIEQLKEKAETLKADLKEANFERVNTRKDLIQLNDKINAHQEDYDIVVDNLRTASKVGESEIIKMEAYINRKALEYDAPTLTILIDQVCEDKFWYSTNNKIIYNQQLLVDNIAEDIALDYNEKIDSLKQQINEIKESINVLKPRIRNIYANQHAEKSTEESQKDSMVVSKFKSKSAILKQCLEDLRTTKLEFKARQEAVDSWVLRTKSYLAREDEDKVSNDELCQADLDNSILEAFLMKTLYKIEDFGSKKKLEEMLGFYIDKVARREKSIQKCYCDSLEVKKHLDSSKKELTSIQIPDQAYHSIKNELKQVTLRQKAIELLIEERRAQLEFEILKQGEENFQMYLDSNSDVFTNVKKTYGNKISEKMKTEQKQEFIDMIRQQYEKRYNEIKTTHYQILEVDSKLDECDTLIGGDLPEQLNDAEEGRMELQEKLVAFKQQLAAFVCAENECIEVIEELLESKKEEIYHQNNELYRDNNYENINSRIHEVQESVNSKDRATEKNQKVIEETELGMFNRNTKYAAEEAQMRARIDNLKLGEREIKQTVRPQLLNLKREIKELNFEIINGKKKMEGIEDKMQKWAESLSLAKEAYIDKFGLDPDEISGSPVKKTEFEYTKEYQNLRTIEPEEFKLEDEFNDEQSEIVPEHEEEKMLDEEKQLGVDEVLQNQQSKQIKKKKIESVSLDLSELINMNLKPKQQEVKLREEEEQIDEEDDDIVHISLINNATKLKVNIKGMSDKDIEFLESIRPLLEGKELYKKLSNSSSQIPFNPFENKKPEKCGFGKRLIRLNPEDISQVFLANKMDIRKNGYYIEKRGKDYCIMLCRGQKSIPFAHRKSIWDRPTH